MSYYDHLAVKTSKELNDAEYAAMLAGGNVSLAWHSIDRKKFNFDTVTTAMEQAVYNAVRQVFSDRLQIELPTEMPKPFGDEEGG